jgi:hypothetical protein
MKKLIVLMIVLFPVTAWAGAHDKKTRAELCAQMDRSATFSLQQIDRLESLGSKALGKDESQAKRWFRYMKEQRAQLAEEAAIYSAFCK